MVSVREFNDRNRMLQGELQNAYARFGKVHTRRWELFFSIKREARAITDQTRSKIIEDLKQLLGLIEEDGRALHDMEAYLSSLFRDAAQIRKYADERVLFKSVPNYKHLSSYYFNILGKIDADLVFFLHNMGKDIKRERRYIKAILGHWYSGTADLANFQEKFSENYEKCMDETDKSRKSLEPIIARAQAAQRDLSKVSDEIKNMMESMIGGAKENTLTLEKMNLNDRKAAALAGPVVILAIMAGANAAIGCALAAGTIYLARKFTA